MPRYCRLKWEHPFNDSVYIYLHNYRPCGQHFVPANCRRIISAKIMHQCMCFNIIGRPDNLEVLIRAKALCDDCASCEIGTKRTARVTGWLHLFERVASSFSDFLGARFQTEPPRGSSITAACSFVSNGRAGFVRLATARGSQMTPGCPSPADGALVEVPSFFRS